MLYGEYNQTWTPIVESSCLTGDLQTAIIWMRLYAITGDEKYGAAARKAMPERPIPEEIMTELSNYVARLPDGQEKLFVDKFSPKRCEKIRKAVGLPNLKFHDLRKTFASLLAQRGVSTTVTQRLLEHASPQLTNDFYTNVDLALRQAINLLPVADWL